MNCPVDASKIVSMIIQDLRQFNYGALIDIVKKQNTPWTSLTMTTGTEA